MDNRKINDAVLREYLLGRVEIDQELVEHIDEQILTDPDFSDSVDIVEDEIIEEYLEGSLDEADKQSFEKHFLRPPERQRKLRNARLLSHHLKATLLHREETQTQKKVATRTLASILPHVLTMPSFRTCVEIAASVLFAASILYSWNQQRELTIAVKQSRQELESWKRRQTQSTSVTQAAVVTLNLAVSGLSRGNLTSPEVHLPLNASTLQVSVALIAKAETPLSVRLQQGETVVWSRNGVKARPVTGGAVLSVDIPATLVPEGKCEIVVSGLGPDKVIYLFRVSRAE